MERRTHPAAERLLPVALLTLSGGLQDTYTYLRRGKVFANAQTGNIVLLGQSLFDGDWSRAARYFLPVLAFALGVAAAERLQNRIHGPNWQRQVLLWEILLLFLVGFIPHSLDQLANALVSFSCAMQVQAFRRVEGFAFASTMCIGNLRSGTEALCTFLRTRDRQEGQKARLYFFVIFLFALGAEAGSLAVELLDLPAIWLSCVLLALGSWPLSRQ
ncbi:MAG: DUF1275 domain-containing protein [Lawsonibacter sp.]|jgi:uncharacterized membrane protein YoaK (UPF0700 family)|nr:DUF1275 domain-containing protein [Lawsonibacter sp.]MCI9566859.1 DUF1275 domain-containing protein [Lawsonibacter sp.]